MNTNSTATRQALSNFQREQLLKKIDDPIFELFPLLHREHLLKLFAKYYLEIKDVMAITGYCRTTIWKLDRSGKLKRCAGTGLRRPRYTVDALLECFAPMQLSN